MGGLLHSATAGTDESGDVVVTVSIQRCARNSVRP